MKSFKRCILSAVFAISAISTPCLCQARYRIVNIYTGTQYEIHSGTGSAFRGPSRVTLPIYLPLGAVEVFVSVKGSVAFDAAPALGLARNLAAVLASANPNTVALAPLIRQLPIPKGNSEFDVFFLDNAACSGNFIAKKAEQSWMHNDAFNDMYNFPGVQGGFNQHLTVDTQYGTELYLALRNPSRFSSIWAVVDVVAVVQE